MKRIGYYGSCREENVGEAVTVMGWVQTKRDMSGVIFIDLRIAGGRCRWCSI